LSQKDLKERNIQPLSDDYIKFIRYGQYFVEKNGSGILAYISNNSFIDGIIHRQMRKRLLQAFDKIYILDLHGNAKKKEVSPDGSPDQNVFDIMQGVSINIFIKTGTKKKNRFGKVFHFDLYGKRDLKYVFLSQNSINSLEWNELENVEPNYFFVKKDFSEQKKYEEGFKIDELFKTNTSGIKTHNDSELVSFEPFLENNFVYNYRPFDLRFINYDLSKVVRARYSVMNNFIRRENFGLILMRKQQNIPDFKTVLLSKSLSDINFYGFQTYVFPLYLYLAKPEQLTIGITDERTPNLNLEIVDRIATKLGLTFTNEKETTENTFAPIDMFDYIYAVLHSPAYRKKYKEFLKIDFPRVPYPKTRNTFWELVKLGGEIRQIHLLESPVVENYITQYPIDGDNVVDNPKYKNKKVYINETQYFDQVPEMVWEFYIGGYQPAQKWLKDRRGRKLEFEDILHYQRIIVALCETDRLMNEIDRIDFME